MKKNKMFISVILSSAIFTNTVGLANASVSKKTIDTSVSKYRINTIDTKTYFISPACAPNSMVDINRNGIANGTNCHLWRFNYSFAQQFKLTRRGSDKHGVYFTIAKSKMENKVLDVSGGVVRNGQNIQLYDYNATKSQQWYLKSAGNNSYYLESRLNTNYVMDVSGGGYANGTNIHLYSKNNTLAQKFSFYICNHENKKRFSLLTNDWTDMYWYAGWKCSDCGEVLSSYSWQIPN
ncbi:MAG: RICIN domain-containing protein [Oscillospiraceae bacterium]|nr:RICIN domain-containing protein [Oscillospiraceae bacterium]